MEYDRAIQMRQPSAPNPHGEVADARTRAAGRVAVGPQTFSSAPNGADAGHAYLDDTATCRLVEFFEGKGLAALKLEDRREQWYADWVEYQAAHHIYATALAPRGYSTRGGAFDLLRYARLLEVFAYFSPAHGYSLQVTFLGLFSILMGSNDALKREAVAALEAGGLLAFGVSERAHGSDLLANEFTLTSDGDGRFVADGRKFYIGNCNVAAIVAVLGREVGPDPRGRAARASPALFALRPGSSPGFKNNGKIRTLGVRAAHVGEIEVAGHELGESDVIARGRGAWDAVLGTVTLGKFFLGFGSIGICEHALAEARDYLRVRTLYGRPAIEMPHIRSMMAHAYVRLCAMKLYAYRALDYVHAARADDRRYLLFCAVQKARVSAEGVRVVTSLAECAGAKGFESDTYLEMALRDAPLIPGLEGSAHINLVTAAQFIPRYFGQFDRTMGQPPALAYGETPSTENEYLMTARTTRINTIGFPPSRRAYVPLGAVANVRVFVRQVRAMRAVLQRVAKRLEESDTQLALALGQCLATIAYAQLIAEHGHGLGVGPELLGAVFHQLVADLNAAALALATLPQLAKRDRARLRRLVSVPRTTRAEWDWVCAQTNDVN